MLGHCTATHTLSSLLAIYELVSVNNNVDGCDLQLLPDLEKVIRSDYVLV